jgi:hypothetical protein
MQLKKIIVESLVRQLNECDKSAEVMMTVGNIPLALPISSLLIKENSEKKEIVTLNIDYEDLMKVFEIGNKLLKNAKNMTGHKKAKYRKDIKKIKRNKAKGK